LIEASFGCGPGTKGKKVKKVKNCRFACGCFGRHAVADRGKAWAASMIVKRLRREVKI
jgi:hypothetical protein